MRQQRGRTVGGTAATAVWSCLLLGLWIALTDTTRPWELVAGVVCAVAAALALRGVARLGGVRLAVRPPWLWRAALVPWWIVRDSAGVLRALVLRRPTQGRTRV